MLEHLGVGGRGEIAVDLPGPAVLVHHPVDELTQGPLTGIGTHGPAEVLRVTMFAALTDQKSGNSTPRCSKFTEPSRQFVITTSRRSQLTSSYGCTPDVVYTRSTRRPLLGNRGVGSDSRPFAGDPVELPLPPVRWKASVMAAGFLSSTMCWSVIAPDGARSVMRGPPVTAFRRPRAGRRWPSRSPRWS